MSVATAPTITTWAIDASHSHADFSIKHMMISTVKGGFADLAGHLEINEENFADSSVHVEIRTASVSTRDEKRDEHLRSADFFDAETYPVMSFTSTSVVPGRGDEFTLVGDLTIRGVTRQVEINAEKTGTGVNPWGMSVMGFEGNTKINRKDFGLEWNVALETGGILVGDDVKIHLDIQASKQ